MEGKQVGKSLPSGLNKNDSVQKYTLYDVIPLTKKDQIKIRYVHYTYDCRSVLIQGTDSNQY